MPKYLRKIFVDFCPPILGNNILNQILEKIYVPILSILQFLIIKRNPLILDFFVFFFGRSKIIGYFCTVAGIRPRDRHC